MTKLDTATEMLDAILPPGGRVPVADLRWHARNQGIGWRTIERAKRLAGDIRAVKQRERRKLPWMWARG
jgi:hypothetical protein